MGWEKILGTILLFGAAGGVVGGMEENASRMDQGDIRHDDNGAGAFSRAQDNDRLLQLVVDLAVLKDIAPRVYDRMHRKMERLLHLEETLEVQPRKASWGEVGYHYYTDVRTDCKILAQCMVAAKKKDPSAFPNAAKLWDQLVALQKQAQDSAWNINQQNMLLMTAGQ